MFGKTPTERAFYRDMLANGIPVLESANLEFVYSKMADGAVELDFYDVLLGDDYLLFSNPIGDHCVTVKKENVDDKSKFIFYTPSYDAAFENAELVGRILFLIVTLCASEKWLDISSRTSNGKEEKYDFDSEFV